MQALHEKELEVVTLRGRLEAVERELKRTAQAMHRQLDVVRHVHGRGSDAKRDRWWGGVAEGGSQSKSSRSSSGYPPGIVTVAARGGQRGVVDGRLAELVPRLEHCARGAGYHTVDPGAGLDPPARE